MSKILKKKAVGGISLIIGHYYKRADGCIIGPIEKNIESLTHPFRTKNTFNGKIYYEEYMENGQYWGSGVSTILDLIEDLGRHPSDL